MTERIYQSDTMANVLGEVKHDLGRDAVILKTRSFRKGGLLGLIGGKPMWEITACAASEMGGDDDRGQYVPQILLERSDEPLGDESEIKDHAAVRPHTARALAQLAAASPGGGNGATGLAGEVSDLKQMVSMLLHQGNPSLSPATEPLGRFYANLLAQDVEACIAKELIDSLRMDLTGRQQCDEPVVRQELCDRIANRIKTVDPSEQLGTNSRQCRVIALIGPTGVGKTTTIAKLAANFKLRQGLRVGMITIDTYRVAAVDQLQTYAEIVEVPLRTVLSPPELRQGVYALRGMDVVLVDTTGRSQNDLLRLSQLRSFLDAADADEVHVVVSAASNPRCIRGILERFSPLGANRLLVTKLDETSTYGAILSMAQADVGPMAYVTSGQEVPDDIAPAIAEDLAWKIMGGREDA
ncbi:MAG: flagellar biosynthesis protein FlhF [Phycisphaerae bacterium]|jgi:flagellar biosynthesis protein FlhF|nr:flagellar biosynthesis protein FlhF [Phycisphaerae bacterium]